MFDDAAFTTLIVAPLTISAVTVSRSIALLLSSRITPPDVETALFVTNAISNALFDFDKKIKGFASPGAILTGAETRTSAPVRILRDSNTRLAIGKDNIYPVGEGAGYAGGITSAAIDGIKTAISVIKRYKIPN